MPGEHVVVAGAGIIGVSIAYHLAKRGARVTIVEAVQPGGGTTSKSFGWINATFSKRPRAYFDLNYQAMAEWRRLELELNGRLNVQYGGSIAWFPAGPEADDLVASVRAHQQWGYAARLIDQGDFQRLAPSVSPGTYAVACHSEQEAAVDPSDALAVLLERARALGAELRCPSKVTGLDLDGTFVRRIETDQAPIEAATLVLACGVNSPEIAQIAGCRLALKGSPGVLVHLKPQPRLLNCVVLAPGVHCKQGADGRIVAGGQIVAGLGTASTEAADADQILQQVRQVLPDLRDAQVERVTLGYRVMPEDEYPIIGFTKTCRNLYVAAMHSGVTLAPLIGRLAATEIIDGISVDSLQPYRPDRFDC